MTRIEGVDLNLFEFDYDLTFMVFFLDAEGKIYARYGSRGPEGPDARQSLEGLRYTMNSVLEMHGRAKKEYAPRMHDEPKRVSRGDGFRGREGCIHCHRVHETSMQAAKSAGLWKREMVYRYPIPENLGLSFGVDRGNVVKSVAEGSTAARVGLQPGDKVTHLYGVPVHSLGDIQYALDIAPLRGSIQVRWRRGDQYFKDTLALYEGWRKTDVSWRPSLRHFIASARLSGSDLSAEEKAALGLSPRQLAFRQKESVSTQAKDAGIRGGDIIVAIDGNSPELDAMEFSHYIRSHYFVGDEVRLTVVRDGKREELKMQLKP